MRMLLHAHVDLAVADPPRSRPPRAAGGRSLGPGDVGGGAHPGGHRPRLPLHQGDAATVTADLTTLLSPLLRPDVDDVRAGLALFAQHEALGTFDAVLAAACIRAGASALVSADRAFAAIGDLEHLDPADPGFLDALRRSSG